MDYEVVIGLEIHAELSTESKAYCSCKNAFGNEVNTLCCPVCMGMPGALPVLNEKLVEYAIKMGHALNCNINKISKQDRKNYFYADLAKSYQISQADVPICSNGYLDIMVDGNVKKIGITRIHIEEDTGKLLHNENFAGTLIDLNRSSVPLIEIVSEPDIRSAQEAKVFLESIKLILQYLDISDCKMQEGSIRCDVNVSVMKKGSTEFGTRVEMKNVNSFSGAVRGIEYESKRQIELLKSGGVISQETRKWDDAKGESISMRSKENAQDYRYFPEPDLLTIVLEEEYVQELKESLPELPNEKLFRFVDNYKLGQSDAELLVENLDKALYFEQAASLNKVNARLICNWVLGDISRHLNETSKEISQINLSPNKLVELIGFIEDGSISNASAKVVFEEILLTSKSVKDIIQEKSLTQISDDSELLKIVKVVLESNPKSVEDYNSGKTNALGFLVGQCMKATKGQGNPGKMKEILLELI